VAVERTARYLNWKFCDQPHVAYRRFVAQRNDCLVGYIVLRAAVAPESSIGIIADLMVSLEERERVSDLTVLAVDKLQESGVEKVRVGTSLPEVAQVLRRLGFRPTRSYVPMCHSADLAVCEDATTLFGLGDHDLDQFPTRK
jgi:hypothetical protein